MFLTYRGNDEQYEEGVEDGHDGGRQRRYDVAQRAHAAKEAHDAEGAEGAQHVDGHGHGAQRDERQGNDDEIEVVPAVAQEGADPVGVEVDGELDCEDDGEEHVQQLEKVAKGGRCPAACIQGAGELRLGCIDHKVLPRYGGSICPSVNKDQGMRIRHTPS